MPTEINPIRRLVITQNDQVPVDSKIVFAHLDKRFMTIGDWSKVYFRSKQADLLDQDESPRVRNVFISGRPFKREISIRQSVTEYNISEKIISITSKGFPGAVWTYHRWTLTPNGDWTRIELHCERVLRKIALPLRPIFTNFFKKFSKNLFKEFMEMLASDTNHVFSSEELISASQPTCAYPEGWSPLIGENGIVIDVPPEPEESINESTDDISEFMKEDYHDTDAPTKSQLQKLNKQELVELAEKRDLDTMGTKAVIIERILNS